MPFTMTKIHYVRTPKHPCGVRHKSVTTGGVFGGDCDSWMRVGFGGVSSLECGALSDEPSFVWSCLVFRGMCHRVLCGSRGCGRCWECHFWS